MGRMNHGCILENEYENECTQYIRFNLEDNSRNKTQIIKEITMDYPVISAGELDKVEALISNRKSFSIIEAKDTSSIADIVEKKIEAQNLKCRVRVSHRAAVLATALIPTGVTQATAVATAVGIVAHNIATWNPDYEIIKCLYDNKVEVEYKKDK